MKMFVSLISLFSVVVQYFWVSLSFSIGWWLYVQGIISPGEYLPFLRDNDFYIIYFIGCSFGVLYGIVQLNFDRLNERLDSEGDELK